MDPDITQKVWWNYLIENQKDLLAQSLVLLKREEETQDEFYSLDDAWDKVWLIIRAIDRDFVDCRIGGRG